MIKEMENKKLDLEAMENVTGGTVGEFSDLVSALAHNGVLKKFGKISAHLPIGNEKSAEIVEGILKQNGIDAHIDLGWHGTGIGSEKNTYTNKHTGKSMSHEEVLNYIKTSIKVA